MSTRTIRTAAILVALLAVAFFGYRLLDRDDVAAPDAPVVAATTPAESLAARDAAPAAAPAATADAAEQNGEAANVAPPVIAAPTPASQDACAYDAEKSPVPNFDQLVSFTDAMLGDSQADVTVVEYFDPNCSHCKALHPIMMQLAEKYEDRARFVFKPFPLRPNEAPWLMQTEALHAAQQEGKFFPMMEAQMSRQHLITNVGLPLNALRAAATDAGMDADAMMKKIQSGVFRTHVKNEYEKALAAGLTGTPMVIINGNVVPAPARTLDCLGRLIERAAS